MMMKRSILFLFLTCILCQVQAQTLPFYNIQEWQTAKGLQVRFYQTMEVPILDVKVAFKAGSAYDGSSFGLSALTTSLLNQGNDGLDASAIAAKIASTGAKYSSDNNQDMAVFSLRTVTAPSVLEKSLSLFQVILSKPDFPATAFVQKKNQQAMAIQHGKESPMEVATQAFFKTLYVAHPYGHPILGSQENLKAIDVLKVKEFYKQYFVASNAVMVLVGAISLDEAHKISENLSQALAQGQAASPVPLAVQEPAQTLNQVFPSTQTILKVGEIGIDYHDKNYFPLLVGNYILGGNGLVSQLSQELREKRGLTYGVSSQFMPLMGKGPFVVSMATENKQAPDALKLVKMVVGRFLTEGPSEKELQSAKEYLLGNFPVSLSSNEKLASILTSLTFYQLPKDFLNTYPEKIKAVTLEDVKKSFATQLYAQNFSVISVGKS